MLIKTQRAGQPAPTHTQISRKLGLQFASYDGHLRTLLGLGLLDVKGAQIQVYKHLHYSVTAKGIRWHTAQTHAYEIFGESKDLQAEIIRRDIQSAYSPLLVAKSPFKLQ